jgi:hypothetical protein
LSADIVAIAAEQAVLVEARHEGGIDRDIAEDQEVDQRRQDKQKGYNQLPSPPGEHTTDRRYAALRASRFDALCHTGT